LTYQSVNNLILFFLDVNLILFRKMAPIRSIQFKEIVFRVMPGYLNVILEGNLFGAHKFVETHGSVEPIFRLYFVHLYQKNQWRKFSINQECFFAVYSEF